MAPALYPLAAIFLHHPPRGLEVGRSGDQGVDAIAEIPDPLVAVGTQESSNSSGGMIVVNGESLDQCGRRWHANQCSRAPYRARLGRKRFTMD